MRENFRLKLRHMVVGAQESVPLLDGSCVTGINLDNAATTPPFYAVMKEINAFLPWYSSVHRGAGYKSVLSSDIYEDGRKAVRRFVGGDAREHIVIYTKNTTEAINIAANALWQNCPDGLILSTEMEHLANDLPWRSRFQMEYAKVDADGRLDLNDVEAKLKKCQGKIRLVTVSGASNVTGYVNPIGKIARLAHRYGAEILVDGAQLVPHQQVDMQEAELDYLVFSAHKMYAPFGSGALVGRKRIFENSQPNTKGGGAVKLVTHEFVDWDLPPYREEAGTPNVVGVLAMTAAMHTLSRVGMKAVHQEEQKLIDYIICGLRTIPGICLYGCPAKPGDKVSIIAFQLESVDHRMVAKILSYEAGIAVRSGLFCAHPYVQRVLGLTKEQIATYREQALPFPGLVRISLGLYNTYQEADKLLYYVRQIAQYSAYYKEKYGHFDEKKHLLNPLLHPLQRELP